MIQLFSTIAKQLSRRALPPPADADREIDLLAHPALKAMSPRELADIPFPRTRPHSPQSPAHRRH